MNELTKLTIMWTEERTLRIKQTDIFCLSFTVVAEFLSLFLTLCPSKASKLSKLEGTGFDICFRVCQSGDQSLFRLQKNGDLTE